MRRLRLPTHGSAAGGPDGDGQALGVTDRASARTVAERALSTDGLPRYEDERAAS